jgi:hypothetical protein
MIVKENVSLCAMRYRLRHGLLSVFYELNLSEEVFFHYPEVIVYWRLKSLNLSYFKRKKMALSVSLACRN